MKKILLASLLAFCGFAHAQEAPIDQADSATIADAPSTPACGSVKKWSTLPPTEIGQVLADCGGDGAGTVGLSRLEPKTAKCSAEEGVLIRRSETARAAPKRVQSQKQCSSKPRPQQKVFKDPRCLMPLFPPSKKNQSTPKAAKIVIHHTGGKPGDTANGIYNHHVKTLGYNEVGYHYLISRGADGKWKVTETRPPWAEGAHVFATANKQSIAIAIAGNYQGTTELNGATRPQKNDTFPEPGAVAELAKLVRHLETKEAIKVTGFEGHDQALEKNHFCHKGCPGPGCAPLVAELNKWHQARAGQQASASFEPVKWLIATRLLAFDETFAARSPARTTTTTTTSKPVPADPALAAARATLEGYVAAYYAGDLKALSAFVTEDFLETTGGEEHWKKMLGAVGKTKIVLREVSIERLGEVLLARFDVRDAKTGRLLESVPRTAAFILARHEQKWLIEKVETEALDLQ